MKLSFAIATSVLASFCAKIALSEDTSPTNPPCEICGCSFCPDGFLVGNPGGTIPIPPEFVDQAPPGFTEVPCSLLDFAGTAGQIPEELCNDELRLLPEFRQICGCPPLPPTEMPVGAPTDAPITNAPVVAPTNAPVVSSAEEPTGAPVASPPTNAPVMPPPTPVAMPSPVVVPAPTVDKGDYPRHYIDEVDATALGSPWATVTDVTDKAGTAGFMHEYCTRTSPGFWYCTGTYVDLYYDSKRSYRRQFHGNLSFAGWFSDSSMEGVFTITGGTDDFREAKGHISVCHEGGMSQRELHVWY